MEYTSYIHRAFIFRQFRKQGQCKQNPDSPSTEINKHQGNAKYFWSPNIIEGILYILL